jgi:hypothetical protein
VRKLIMSMVTPADEAGPAGFLLTKTAKSHQDTNDEGHPTEGGAEQ